MKGNDWTTYKADCKKRGYFYDHRGNKYQTVEEMCKHYNIAYRTFSSRLMSTQKPWSLRDALEAPVPSNRVYTAEDHLGRQFIDNESMCEYWGVDYDTFVERLNEVPNIEYALTGQNSAVLSGKADTFRGRSVRNKSNTSVAVSNNKSDIQSVERSIPEVLENTSEQVVTEEPASSNEPVSDEVTLSDGTFEDLARINETFRGTVPDRLIPPLPYIDTDVNQSAGELPKAFVTNTLIIGASAEQRSKDVVRFNKSHKPYSTSDIKPVTSKDIFGHEPLKDCGLEPNTDEQIGASPVVLDSGLIQNIQAINEAVNNAVSSNETSNPAQSRETVAVSGVNKKINSVHTQGEIIPTEHKVVDDAASTGYFDTAGNMFPSVSAIMGHYRKMSNKFYIACQDIGIRDFTDVVRIYDIVTQRVDFDVLVSHLTNLGYVNLTVSQISNLLQSATNSET